MRSNLQIQKELLSPPGDTIQETIDTIGMSQAELAERIGRPKQKLNVRYQPSMWNTGLR